MHAQRTALASAMLIAALAAARGEAGPIPWSYEWNTQPVVCNADTPGPSGSPAGGIHLTPGAITITGNPHGIAWGSSSIVAVKLTTFDFSPNFDGPDRFTNTPYELKVKLTDVASQTWGNLNFSGVFNGSMTDSTVNLQTQFTSSRWQRLQLGQNVYTVTLTNYSPPGPPSIGSEGQIAAFVDVHPVGAPEPSALSLAGVGVLAALLSRWRRQAKSHRLLRFFRIR